MENRRGVTIVVLGGCAVAVLLTFLAPAGGTVSTGSAAMVASSSPCASPGEPNAPSPATGATGVAVDTRLSWNVPAPKGCDRVRLLASTGGIGPDPHPFGLVELATDPMSQIPIGPAFSLGFVASLDFSPDGLLYGSDGEFCVIDPGTGSTRTVCEALSTAEGRPVLLTGIAFHPNGTLYGVEWDMDTDDNVFYTADLAKGIATEVCRIPAFEGDAWGIDFSPDGVLYGAFAELAKFDLAKGTATIVGRRFSLPFVNDIDYARDGFLYGIDNMESMLYKIDPATGSVVEEYGPYDSELWGIASECAASSSSGRTTDASIQALDAAAVAGEELAAMAKRGLKLDRLARRSGVSGAEATSLLLLHAAGGSSGITCDVYLDTVSPPVKLTSQNVQPPETGDVWTCDPGVLRPDLTYYWQVVVKNACGTTIAGPVWSFTTKGPIFKDTFPSTTIDAAKWAVVKDAGVDDLGLSEPSAPYSLRLNAHPNGGDAVESVTIDLSGYAKVTLSYYYEQGANLNDPDENDDLIVEYYDGTTWVELSRQLGKDPAMTTYKCVTVPLPAGALTAQFKLRIRCVGTGSGGGPFVNDEWFVDDVTLYSE